MVSLVVFGGFLVVFGDFFGGFWISFVGGFFGGFWMGFVGFQK